MDKLDQAVNRLSQTEGELRDLNHEAREVGARKLSLQKRLDEVAASAPPAEIERLRYLIGQCDLQLDTAKRRRGYLERRGANEYEEIQDERRLRPGLKPKRPKM